MNDPPKRIRRMVREYAGLAYEAELRQALLSLAAEFDRWRGGELSSAELSDRIHRFHDGAARELWKSYNLGDPAHALAYAIHSGVLDRSIVPHELLEHLCGILEAMARAGDGEGVGEAGEERDGEPTIE